VLNVRYGPGEAGAEGSVKKAVFSKGGQSVMCTDSLVKHAFTFTPAISFFVLCESEEESRRLSSALSQGGAEFMPLGAYGFSRQFAWVSDRFGVLAIESGLSTRVASVSEQLDARAVATTQFLIAGVTHGRGHFRQSYIGGVVGSKVGPKFPDADE